MPACANCVRRSHPCTYTSKKIDEPNDADAVVDNEAKETSAVLIQPDLVSKEAVVLGADLAPESGTVMSLVQAYFKHLYPLPEFGFLHQRSLVQRCREGSVQPSLVLALCAVTAQHLMLQPYCPGYVSQWLGKAEEDLMLIIGSPSIPRLQALVLVIRCMIHLGQFSKAFMLTALAARAAAALCLYQERPDLHFLAQESRRRLMWACALLDARFSGGLKEYETVPIDAINIQLPCPEEAFQNGNPTSSASLRSASTDTVELLSLYGVAIRMNMIRRAVMR